MQQVHVFIYASVDTSMHPSICLFKWLLIWPCLICNTVLTDWPQIFRRTYQRLFATSWLPPTIKSPCDVTRALETSSTWAGQHLISVFNKNWLVKAPGKQIVMSWSLKMSKWLKIDSIKDLLRVCVLSSRYKPSTFLLNKHLSVIKERSYNMRYSFSHNFFLWTSKS